jgi:hypothetical protein
MSRSDLVPVAVASALALWGPAAVAASLKAVGIGYAQTHAIHQEAQPVVTPGPGSLTVSLGATADEYIAHTTPPPDGYQMLAGAEGVGTARYGTLGGRAHAEASLVPATELLRGGARARLDLGFDDGVEVVSGSLAPGTPVTLTFQMTLEATALYEFEISDPTPDGIGSSARFEVEVRDLDDVLAPFGEGALLVNSLGDHETFGTFELDTAVGHRLAVVADLFVVASVDIDFLEYGFSQGLADVVADQTARLSYQPAGDVTLVSDSGHDYAVPEPGRAAWLVASATLCLLRRRLA